jgi:hypothetical protein
VGGIQARQNTSRKREKAARKKKPAQEKKVAGPVVGIQPLNQVIEPPILSEVAHQHWIQKSEVTAFGGEGTHGVIRQAA